MTDIQILSNRDSGFKSEWFDLLQYDPVHKPTTERPADRRFQKDRLVYVLTVDGNPEYLLEVALGNEFPKNVDWLWKLDLFNDDPIYAIFYSVFKLPFASTPGLAGKLILTAADNLKNMFTHLEHFVTFSPIPTLAKQPTTTLSEETVTALLVNKQDSVARFHLGNGATVRAVIPNADSSQQRLDESYGWMASYEY